MRRAAALASLALVAAQGAAAQEVEPCGWQSSAAAIVEPWAENSRTLSNGAVRLALLDTVEPAAAAFWLLILSPPYDELGTRQCRVVGMGGMGFGDIDFAAMQASYDPATGLTFTLPVGLYDAGTGGFASQTLHVTLNQSTGSIGTDLTRE